jgi:tetrahydromethanopterin S-methyltransferase subunit D
MMRVMLCGLLVSVNVLLVGCGGDPAPATTSQATGPTGEQALNDLGGMLKMIAEQKKKPPTKKTELDEYEPVFMAAARGIQSGDVNYIWGAGIQSSGNAVVAHEKDAESKGGYVLLQNGSVKKMSAEEFKAAPKAAKK